MGLTVTVTGVAEDGVTPSDRRELAQAIAPLVATLSWGCEAFTIDADDSGRTLEVLTKVQQAGSDDTWRDLCQCIALAFALSRLRPRWRWVVSDDLDLLADQLGTDDELQVRDGHVVQLAEGHHTRPDPVRHRAVLGLLEDALPDPFRFGIEPEAAPGGDAPAPAPANAAPTPVQPVPPSVASQQLPAVAPPSEDLLDEPTLRMACTLHGPVGARSGGAVRLEAVTLELSPPDDDGDARIEGRLRVHNGTAGVLHSVELRALLRTGEGDVLTLIEGSDEVLGPGEVRELRTLDYSKLDPEEVASADLWVRGLQGVRAEGECAVRWEDT